MGSGPVKFLVFWVFQQYTSRRIVRTRASIARILATLRLARLVTQRRPDQSGQSNCERWPERTVLLCSAKPVRELIARSMLTVLGNPYPKVFGSVAVFSLSAQTDLNLLAQFAGTQPATKRDFYSRRNPAGIASTAVHATHLEIRPAHSRLCTFRFSR